jgi:hypothetical protein
MMGMGGMNGATGLLVVWIFLIVLIARAAPDLVAVMNAAMPLVIVVGIVVAVLRVVWFYTNRY